MTSRYKRNRRTRRRLKKRRNRRILILLILLIAGLLVWGKLGEINVLTTNDYSINDEVIPECFNGVKIVHFSDVHYGVGFDDKRLEKLVDKINSYKPDVVVFSGDLIDKEFNPTDDNIKSLIRELSRIDSKLGKYAVYGNHDYNDHYSNIMYDSDFMILKNNYDTIYNKENDPILIYGIDDTLVGTPGIKTLKSKKIKNIDYRIVVVHEPDYVDEFVNETDVSLILSGHSHDGQVNIPGLNRLLLPKGAKTYYKPYYKLEDTKLYISNGVGNTFYDFRLFTPPSINVYRLHN